MDDEGLPIPDFRAFTDGLVTGKGYTRNPCREHCPYPEEHAHLRTPGGNRYDDFITFADGRYSGYDLTQACPFHIPGSAREVPPSVTWPGHRGITPPEPALDCP